MKKIILISFLFLFISCSPRMITIGTVSLLNSTGEVVQQYKGVTVPENINYQDTLSNISFIDREGVLHQVQDGNIIIEGIEQVDSRYFYNNNKVYIYQYPQVYRRYYYSPQLIYTTPSNSNNNHLEGPGRRR